MEELRERILNGALVTAAEYTQAQRLRAQICRETADVLRDVDVLVTPTTLKPATTVTLAQDPEFGFPKSNMPPGRPFAEGTVLRVGHAYEQATTWHTRRPLF